MTSSMFWNLWSPRRAWVMNDKALMLRAVEFSYFTMYKITNHLAVDSELVQMAVGKAVYLGWAGPTASCISLIEVGPGNGVLFQKDYCKIRRCPKQGKTCPTGEVRW